jgi:alpha/beta superfamily hydrolase
VSDSAERIQTVEVPGPAGKLEARLHLDADRAPAGLAVVCHPHPQHGGNMNNKVVHRLDRALYRGGRETLRFNYRGVGASAGSWAGGDGELDDTRSAIGWLCTRRPGLPLVLAGFSFGAARAVLAGAGDPRVERVIAVGAGHEAVAALERAPLGKPLLLIHGELDETVPIGPVRELVARHPDRGRLVVVPGADHFFQGHLDALDAALVGFI